jgi:hypothetical protein
MCRKHACGLLALFAFILSSAGTTSAAADTPAPWWGLTTGARPTNLAGGSGVDEIQQLTVHASKGDYIIANPTTFVPQLLEVLQGRRTVEQLTGGAVLPFDATAAQVRAALERAFPGQVLTVQEQASSEEHTSMFTITFPGQLVEPLLTEHGFFVTVLGGSKLELEGGTPEVKASEVQKGAESENEVVVMAQNLGNAPTSGPISVTDRLPPGLTPTKITGHAGSTGRGVQGPVTCETKNMTCGFETNFNGEPGVLPPFEVIEMHIHVQVSPAAKPAEPNAATVAGGGAPTATASHSLAVGAARHFGVENFSLAPESRGGSLDTQAASHPFQLTTTVTLVSQTSEASSPPRPRAVALAKDISVDLPPGLIGNPTPFVQCTATQFATEILSEHDEFTNACPEASAIGVATVTVDVPGIVSATLPEPIFNMVPGPGEPARFAFDVDGVPAFLDASVRTGSDYGVTVSSLRLPQTDWLIGATLTFWGVPGDPAHDQQRGWSCLLHTGGPGACPATAPTAPPPFLEMPSSCAAPFSSTVHADSWEASGKPAEVAEPLTYTLPEAVDGCNHLPFSPEIRATPDGTAASTPTGIGVDVHVPQAAILNAESLGESAIKEITVALPQGVSVNPAGGDGLAACTEGLAGFTGFSEPEPGTRTAAFTPTLPEPLQPGSNFCPDASKIGTVEIASPLLPAGQHLKGSVYLATQNENPFGSLIALYVIAKDPISGVLVKLPGEVHLTATGQLLTTFKNTPQLAFEDAEFHFFGGERAPLSTPDRCGPYTTRATFTPWSGNEAISSSSTFDITSGPQGSSCPGSSLPFSPTLTGGTTNINAGSFTPLSTTIGRADGQQDMQSVQLHMPAGVSGLLTGVKLCPEAQANEGACGPESLIGEATVSAGVGSDPVTVTGGRLYITEPYAGSPFGLSIVAPVKAGPFDLEHDTANPAQLPACDCVVVRARIDVDPTTAALTITTDPSGPHAIPRLIDGVPVQIQKVNVLVNRPDFTFNPTNCGAAAITGSIAGYEGGSSPVSVPFQVADCATLGFKPMFGVSTSGKTSRNKGASLQVKLAYPNAPFGTQANVKSVKVDLPHQLPSRLTTLQKACPDRVFNADPASCPAASRVGSAIATTPLVPVPLAGPAYFVSHGGAKFPELIVVLSGYGVTLDLHGETFINKAGITSSTFSTVPDAPVGTFELTLPEGPNSALAANGNLCASSLKMPTTFVAQNGIAIHQSTPISVTGCKRAIRIAGHSVKGSHASIRVTVPSAGTLVAGGRGLRGSVKRVGKAGTVTIGVTLTSRGQRVLSKNPHQRVNANVKMRFSRGHGAPLTAHVRLLMG